MIKTILFADYKEDILFVTEILLRVAGYNVRLESNIDFADNPQAGNLPDVYLLDRHMYGHDLLQVCKRSKTDSLTSHIPVIMVSADPDIKALYKEALADDCVTKPFERYQLLDAIARVL